MKRGPIKKTKGLQAKVGLSSNKKLVAIGGPTKKTKIKAKSKGLIHEADRVFSLYIRSLNDTKLGVKCYTCPSYLPVEEIQLGHFISRGRLDRRFDKRNCKPQCPTCNVVKGGNLIEFERQLVIEYGKEVVSSLKKYDNSFKLTESFLKQTINECKGAI